MSFLCHDEIYNIFDEITRLSSQCSCVYIIVMCEYPVCNVLMIALIVPIVSDCSCVEVVLAFIIWKREHGAISRQYIYIERER